METMQEMAIKVLEIRFVTEGRPLKAFVDIQFGDLVIREFRIIHRTGERISVSPPLTSWRDPETKQIQFKGIITFPREQKQAIDIAILHAYHLEREKRNGKQL